MAFLQKRRNAKGETIWVIHYRIGSKQKMKTIGKTDKRTAQKALIKFEADLAKQDFEILERTQVCLNEFTEEYLTFAETGKANSTFTREKQILKLFSEHFGDVYLTNLTVKEIEEYRLMRTALVSPETVNLEFRHLKAIFNRALSFGYIARNPFAKIKPYRVPESDLPRFLELEEIEVVRSHFKGSQFESLVDFYLLTGARLREPLSLSWEDVDLNRNFLRIKSIHTKSKKHRLISFKDDQQLEDLLKNLPKRNDDLLFGPRDGKTQWTPWWVSRKISLELTKIGFSWASCHTFRHTFISHLVMQGVPLLTVKELVGHSDIKTTLRYAHLAPNHTKEMLGKRPY